MDNAEEASTAHCFTSPNSDIKLIKNKIMTKLKQIGVRFDTETMNKSIDELLESGVKVTSSHIVRAALNLGLERLKVAETEIELGEFEDMILDAAKRQNVD